MATDLSLQAQNKKSWACWEGSIERIARLAELIEESTEAIRENAAREAASAAREDKFQLYFEGEEDGRERAEAKAESAATAADERVRQELAVTMEARRPEFDTTAKGSPASVLKAIDPKTITELEIKWGRSFYSVPRIQIHFSAKNGCTFEIVGDDPPWVRAVYSAVVDQIQADVPRWEKLRTERGALILAMTTWVALTVPLSVAIFLPIDILAVALAIGASMLFGVLTSISVESAIKRILPGFEILTPDYAGRGRLFMRLVVGWFLGVSSSLVASLILLL